MLDTLSTQRTYALIGHGGCGKTTIAEMMLLSAGVISRLGKIEEGTTALDYEPEEIKRRGSTQPGFASFKWNKNQHFLVDAPGDSNFNGDISYLLSAVDAVVFVLDAVDGVKPLTRRLWKEVVARNLPAMFCVTKMDRDRADFDMAVAGIKNLLGVKPFLLQTPIGQKENFQGVVDALEETAWLFDGKGGVRQAPVPAEMADDISTLHEAMVEDVAVIDEALMERYLDEGSLPAEDLAAAARQGVVGGSLYPVLAVSGLANMGARNILDAIQKYFPSPLEGAREIENVAGAKRTVAETEPFVGFVFKTLFDPFAGQLSIVRVKTGTLNPDSALVNATRDAKERVGQLLLPMGKETLPIKEAVGPGAIVAIPKLKETATGDSLCNEKSPFVLAKPALPNTMITYALAPQEKGDEDKVYQAMAKLLDEDVTLKLGRDEETGDSLLSGMGQSHIENAVEKAKRRFKVGILLKAPTIPYREAIKGKAEVQGRHKKQTGGRGQFGDCWVRIEPLPRGSGYEFVDAIVGGVIPRQYIPAVDKGIQESAARGVLAGFQVVDFKATVFDGSYHNVDSSEMAFKVAGSLAFKKACEQAKLVLLEPIAQMTISVPDEFMGDIIGDLSSRRGKVLGSDSTGGMTDISSHVPMSEVQEYARALSSMTGGQGAFTMVFDHYEEAPPPVTEKVVAEYRKEREKE
jgi:elongation factor G